MGFYVGAEGTSYKGTTPFFFLSDVIITVKLVTTELVLGEEVVV